MELFSELYGCYYAVVANILRVAHQNGVTRADINVLVEQEAFAESGLHLIPRLLNGEWALLEPAADGLFQSKLAHADTSTPLTLLQKRWLKALLADRRIRLFLDEDQLAAANAWLAEIAPLFEQTDFHAFDVAADGDDYTSAQYIQNFRAVLAAIKEKRPLQVNYLRAKNGGWMRIHMLPAQLQYSEKDDKFRVIAGELRRNGKVQPVLLNMGRIAGVQPSPMRPPHWLRPETLPARHEDIAEVTLAISRERNALERCMVQFAFYEKETQAAPNGSYICKIRYNRTEETELLIRILSFGPVVRVLGPSAFLAQVRERVERQWALLQRE